MSIEESGQSEHRIRMPKHFADVQVRVDTLDDTERTIEVIWSTGVKVKRYSYSEGYYMEELVLDPDAIRMERFDTGMSLLDSHDGWSMDGRLGTVVPGSVRFEGGKAYAVLRLSKKQRADDLLQDLRDGHPFQVSVGYRIHKYEKTEGGDGELPTLRAIDWEPMELSAVPIPADAGAHSRSEDGEKFDCLVIRHETEAAGAAIISEETEMSNEQEAAPGAEESVVPAETRTEPGAGSNPAITPGNGVDRAATDEAVRAESNRCSEIHQIGSTHDLPDEMVRAAISNRTPLDGPKGFRSQVMDYIAGQQEGAPTFPVAAKPRGGQDEVETRRTAVANAMVHRFNSDMVELTDAAREWRNISLLEVQRELMRAAGENPRGKSDTEIAERAFHSTSDFPIILGDVVRTTLLSGYNAFANTFQMIAKRNTVTNFKEIRSVRLGENPELVKVDEHGEFPRGTMVEGSESYKICTYGRIIGMTRQGLINDDLNAFAEIPHRWGRQIAKLEGDVAWDPVIKNVKLSSGTALFHNNHGNLGTGAALDIAGLKAGRRAFRKMKDIDGNRIDLAPSYLFVPTDLEVEAQQLLRSTVAATKTDDVVPEAIRSLTPVSEYRLDAVSANCWFLFGNPGDLDGGLEYAYLAGNETPYLDQQMGFNTDGVEFKVRHDFGAGLTDFRFAYKNPGL